MTKTLKQFKEDMQVYGLSLHRNVYISVYCDTDNEKDQEHYGTEEEFYEAVEFNNELIKSIQVFHLTTQTHIDVMVGGN